MKNFTHKILKAKESILLKDGSKIIKGEDYFCATDGDELLVMMKSESRDKFYIIGDRSSK